MEILIFLAVVVGGLLLVGVVKGMNRGAAVGQSIGVTGKIKFTLDWLTANLDSAKLESGEERYTHYFVAYFDECGRAICAKVGVPYHDGNRFLAYMEATKRCGSGAIKDQASLESSKALLEQIRETEPGRWGVEEGRADGKYVAEPTNPGPYYNRAREYFGLPPAERRET